MRILATLIGISRILFWLYWIISAFGSKRGTAPNMRRFFGIRIIILLLVAILALSDKRLPVSFNNHLLGSSVAVSVVGFILFLLGITLAVWARIHLGRNWGMPMTQKEDPELVTTGPYRYIRHPIYTGILLMALGSAIDVNTYWLAVFIVFCAYFVYSAFAEEKLMTQQFTRVYPAYKAKTKMLVPFIF
jgi:protein-S-isoprenylcysteine O-methyltransferase Ste14